MPIGVDIFSGAGGLSLGAEMAGYDIVTIQGHWFLRMIFTISVLKKDLSCAMMKVCLLYLEARHVKASQPQTR